MLNGVFNLNLRIIELLIHTINMLRNKNYDKINDPFTFTYTQVHTVYKYIGICKQA